MHSSNPSSIAFSTCLATKKGLRLLKDSKKIWIYNIYDWLQKQPPEVFYKRKVFLEISQNSQENTCARVSFLIKLQASFFTEHL